MPPESWRHRLPAFAWDHPVTLFMATLAIVVVGIVATMRIPMQLFPSGFDPKFLWIGVPYADSVPLETDEVIVRPVRAQLATVPGISSINSTAEAGRATFEVEFHGTVDMDEAYNAVTDRLERAMADLPDEVDRTWVYRFNPSDEPIVWAGVAIPDAVSDPEQLLERVVRPRLERIPGVATVDVWGVPARRVYVDWDREKLVQHRVNLGSLQRRLATDNFERPAGRLFDRGLWRNLRSFSSIGSVQELRRFPVAEGVVLADVADVALVGARSATISRVDGQRAAALGIRKESSANTVAVAEDVHRVFDELEHDKRLAGAKFHVFFDQGELIGKGIADLEESALEGGLFAIIVLYVFLRDLRTTALIAGTIPISLLITLGVMYLRGGSLNLLSLMGLMLAAGSVVDNAIVVVESIYRRRALGRSPRQAAIEGTGEVDLAVTLSALTTVVVFLPIILMSENAAFSFFFGELGMPVVITNLAALAVALLLAPLATRFIAGDATPAEPRWLLWLQRAYAVALERVLGRPLDAMMALIAALLLTLAIAVPGVDCRSSDEGNLNDFDVRFSLPPQADPAERDAIAHRFEQMVEDHREAWGVRVYRVRVREGEDHGSLAVHLREGGPLSVDEAIEAAKEALPDDIPGVKATIGWGESGGEGDKLNFRITGEDVATLSALGTEAVRRIETLDGVLDAKLTVGGSPRPEVRLVVDRDAARRYGVQADQIGQLVAFALRGNAIEPLRVGDGTIEVGTRFGLEDREDIEKVLDFPVYGANGAPVPVRSLVTVVTGEGPSELQRRDGVLDARISVDLSKKADREAVWGAIEGSLGELRLPRGYKVDDSDVFGDMEEDAAAMLRVLAMSIAFVFLIMALLFESWLLPIAILTSVPLGLAGVYWGLYLTGSPFDTMSGVGLVILVGIVVNNGIVLIDLVGHLRAEGLSRTDALVEGARQRLRPILMTAITAIIGLLPMALGTSTFIGIPYAPLGRTVMSGLAVSTVLTLFYVPVAYGLLDDLKGTIGRWFGLVGRRA